MTSRRVTIALLAIALLTAACATTDRNLPKFGAAQIVARADFVKAIAVHGTDVFYGVSATGNVYRVDTRHPGTPALVTHVDVRNKGEQGLMSLASFGDELYVSFTRVDRRLEIRRVLGPQSPALVWLGPPRPSFDADGHIAVDPTGDLYASMDSRVLRLQRHAQASQTPIVVSDGWVDAFAFNIDGRDRMFVADQAPPRGGKEFVARGRETDHAKRRRFATSLPNGSKPSGVTARNDELLVCRPEYRDVFRLHVGLDNTARRRAPLHGVRCDGAIATMSDGSLITATAHDIRRYPPRR